LAICAQGIEEGIVLGVVHVDAARAAVRQEITAALGIDPTDVKTVEGRRVDGGDQWIFAIRVIV
jgi:hypothetical protein